jgi:hypothetical protein
LCSPPLAQGLGTGSRNFRAENFGPPFDSSIKNSQEKMRIKPFNAHFFLLCPHEESNLDRLVRSEPFYPLNYGGFMETIADWRDVGNIKKSLKTVCFGWWHPYDEDMRSYIQFKERAIALRRDGKTYTEIQSLIGVNIPPSTLCTWFGKTLFSSREKERIFLNGKERIRTGVVKAAETKILHRREHFENIRLSNLYLKDVFSDKDVAKVGLTMLYLCEGSKRRKSSLYFGNSDPGIIQLFLRLFRDCYIVDERKFRGTVQCRADQDTEKLMRFWSETTLIPPNQFFHPQIDKRTIGIPTRKANYRGVCRIDYFSAAIYNELMVIGELLLTGP